MENFAYFWALPETVGIFKRPAMVAIVVMLWIKSKRAEFFNSIIYIKLTLILILVEGSFWDVPGSMWLSVLCALSPMENSCLSLWGATLTIICCTTSSDPHLTILWSTITSSQSEVSFLPKKFCARSQSSMKCVNAINMAVGKCKKCQRNLLIFKTAAKILWCLKSLSLFELFLVVLLTSEIPMTILWALSHYTQIRKSHSSQINGDMRHPAEIPNLNTS